MTWVIVSVVIFTNHLGISLENYPTQDSCWSAIEQKTQRVGPSGTVFYCGIKYNNPPAGKKRCAVGDNTLNCSLDSGAPND